MSQIIFRPSRLHGVAQAPPSKSEAHRALLLAALGRGPCLLRGLAQPLCDDTEAMLDGARALGAKAEWRDGGLLVTPGPGAPRPACDARACAAALRMLIPAFLARGQAARIAMDAALCRRPLAALDPVLRRAGARAALSPPDADGRATLALCGFLPAGAYEVDGQSSSQFASGLLMALAHATDADGRPAPGTLVVKGPVVSRPYLDMTLRLMERFGLCCAEREAGVFELRPSEARSPEQVDVGGDWSQAAVLLCACAPFGGVTVENLARDGLQGDSRIVDILRGMGLRPRYDGARLSVGSPSRDALLPADIDCADIPDLAPILALLCARARGRSTLTGVKRLRAKECDRLAATVDILRQLGARAEAEGDALTVWGGAPFRGGFTADARQDHRMAMLLAVAALWADAPIAVTGAEALRKSWPGFLEDYKRLGGIVS